LPTDVQRSMFSPVGLLPNDSQTLRVSPLGFVPTAVLRASWESLVALEYVHTGSVKPVGRLPTDVQISMFSPDGRVPTEDQRVRISPEGRVPTSVQSC